MKTKTDQVLQLVENFSEARHKNGHPAYNQETLDAFNALKEYLKLQFGEGIMSNKGLTKLVEECGELIQIAAKKIAYPDVDIHPDGKSMSERMTEEMGDVLASIIFVSQKFNIDEDALIKRANHKRELYAKWDKGEE